MIEEDSIEVKLISPDLTRPLRLRVLWPHLSNESECVISGENHTDVIHLGAFLGERILAIGSLFPLSSPKLSHHRQYRLRAMASDPEFRGIHAGKKLVQHAIRLLQSRDIEVLWCDARLIATGFYEKLGFSKLPEVYHVPLIGPHQFMWIEL